MNTFYVTDGAKQTTHSTDNISTQRSNGESDSNTTETGCDMQRSTYSLEDGYLIAAL